MTESDETRTPADIGRRAVLKKGVVGASVAGVVWNAPKVHGLSLRPDYAAAASVPGGVAVADLGFHGGMNPPPATVDYSGQHLGDVTGTGSFMGGMNGSLSAAGSFSQADGVDGCAIGEVTVDWGAHQDADCILNTSVSFTTNTWLATADNCTKGGMNAMPTVHVAITCT